MSRAAGLDIGSSATKAVLLDGDSIARRVVVPSTPDMAAAAARALFEVGAGDCPVLTTGYGRALLAGRIGDVSEITALAVGVEAVLPGTATVIDVGGQDSKAVRVERGRVADFAMNDRCAAGTGRFLEVMSRVLGIPMDAFDAAVAGIEDPVGITSTCAVFAESEVVALLARSLPPARVLAGLLASVSDRIGGLARQVRAVAPVAATGGALRTSSLAEAIGRAIGLPVVVPPDPQLVTALGAALLCRKRAS